MTKQFEMMGLNAHLCERLAARGITEPTPIQTRAIPPAMEGRDVLGLAQTGTGKTAAFGLPLLQRLTEQRQHALPKTTRALILAPTRELVRQIAETLEHLAEGTPLKIVTVVGGVGFVPQERGLARGVDVLVATPGRLMDLIGRKALRLDLTSFLVLDEADQMMDLGFIHVLRQIANMLPKARQTMLFSATMPKQMEDIAGAYLDRPVRVQVNPTGTTAAKVTQEVHYVAKSVKTELLIEHLDAHRDELALVFGRTKHGMEKLSKHLEKVGFAVASIHGNKSQGQRDRALNAFRAGEVRVLVATDVAARELDIPEVRYVYNYELPNVPEAYVHRIGRTARAGRDGKAVAYCSPEEMGELKDIEKLLKAPLAIASGRPWTGPVADAAAAAVKAAARAAMQARSGGRGPKTQGGGAGAGAGAGKPAAAKPAGAKPQGPRPVHPGLARPEGAKPNRRRGGGGGGGRARQA